MAFWAFVLMALLGWVLISRYTGRIDRSWQLLIWLMVVIFSSMYEDTLHPLAVYLGCICALLLRFEFVGGWVMKTIRLFESFAIAILLWQLFRVLRGW